MTQFSPLYEGKAKIIYATADPDILLAEFKDDATAFNAQKRGSIQNKGVMNCAIASHLFQYLAAQGIPNHFIAQVAPNKMHIRRVEIIPLEVVVRNRAAGSLCRQTGLPLGLELNPPWWSFTSRMMILVIRCSRAIACAYCRLLQMRKLQRSRKWPWPSIPISVAFLRSVALPWWTLSWSLAAVRRGDSFSG